MSDDFRIFGSGRLRPIPTRPIDIGLAPLVDVIFLLLIFFMLTSTFVRQSAIQINLPKAVTSDVVQMQETVILVTRDNLLYVDGQIETLESLEKALGALSSKGERAVVIKADRAASLGRVVEVFDTCRRGGISQVHIATNQELR
ncbi:MAG: biopolymer transporter ExbD [Candidatus Omnitrophica bacterium]|nr:biopolymer transporter ExbD [Candidatus Omnitrophota bacterium]